MKRLAIAGLLVASACKAGDPPPSIDGPDRADGAPPDAAHDGGMPDANPACVAPVTDYAPGADDTWPACISDDGDYHPFDISISTIARIGAFETIATLLFTGAAPSAQDFTDARVEYAQANGLESRVSRREDEHYAPAIKDGMAIACNMLDPGIPEDATILAANAERCVGPVRLRPILNQAFATGQDPIAAPRARRLAAARIEGALLWFLYVSVHKEAITCTSVRVDCDSHWAYYTGGEPRSGGKGLARYVRALDLATHDRIWNGALAVRCWRDLDNPDGVAMDLAMRDTAVAQLDRAALRGVAMIAVARLEAMIPTTGDDRLAMWEMLRTVVPVLERAAAMNDPPAASVIVEQAARDAESVDIPALIDAIGRAFPCP